MASAISWAPVDWCRTAPAKNRKLDTALGMSMVRASAMGLPVSWLSSAAKRSRSASIASATASHSSARSAAVPSLLLQPLIENSIKYAVAGRDEGGTIRIDARVFADNLLIEVVDDGPGLDGSPQTLVRDGHGLGNVQGRLRAFYRGGEASLALMRNPEGVGALVRLSVPCSPSAAAGRPRAADGSEER